jgi:hypothetical protein
LLVLFLFFAFKLITVSSFLMQRLELYAGVDCKNWF